MLSVKKIIWGGGIFIYGKFSNSSEKKIKKILKPIDLFL